MKFTLSQLYTNNKTKPFVNIVDADIQWDECNLEGMPDRVTGTSYHNMGKASKVSYEELPKTFKAIDGNEYLIEDIHTIWGGSK
mgnify:FL=1|jgi:hypothetical protein